MYRSTENVLDEEGTAPLHMAVINDNPQCIKLLLNHRANINISEDLHNIAMSHYPFMYREQGWTDTTGHCHREEV